MSEEPEEDTHAHLPDELDQALEELCDFYNINTNYDVEHKGISDDELIFEITLDNDTEIEDFLGFLADVQGHALVSGVIGITFTANVQVSFMIGIA